MTTSCPPELIALAHRLADAAGAAIRPHFRQRFTIEDKDDASPVTIADREAEKAMRALLESERPGDGVHGEEFGSSQGSSGLQWVLDPIDGTRSFMAGRPIFGTLIALMEGDRPLLGVIDQPIAGDRWIGAAGDVTRLNGDPVRTRSCGALERAILGSTAPELFSPDRMAAFQRVNARVKGRLWGGDCYIAASVAMGCLDLLVDPGLKLHDYAALVPVVEGAGGLITDWEGAPLGRRESADILVAGDPALHRAALELLAAPTHSG